MNIWITGVSGFTGTFLVEEIRRRNEGAVVVGLGRQRDYRRAGIEYLSVDLAANPDVHEALYKYPPEIIYHLAGAMPPAPSGVLWHANVASTYNLLAAVCEAGLRNVRFLCVGSAAQYLKNSSGIYREADPALGVSDYGRSKAVSARLADSLGREFGVDVLHARTFNLIGPGLPTRLVAGRICQQLASGKNFLKLGNLSSQRDFIDVRDAVRAYCDIAGKGHAFDTYNVCSGQSTSIDKLVETACAILGDTAPRIETDPEQAARTDIDKVVGDAEKLAALTGWRAQITLPQSLADMLESARS